MNIGDCRLRARDRVTERPYVVLSVAASIDGYIDDNNPERLYLSNEADFDWVNWPLAIRHSEYKPT
jgi:hypothetical protein